MCHIYNKIYRPPLSATIGKASQRPVFLSEINSDFPVDALGMFSPKMREQA
jgi:hypothetical protein